MACFSFATDGWLLQSRSLLSANVSSLLISFRSCVLVVPWLSLSLDLNFITSCKFSIALIVEAHKTKVSPCGIKSDLKHHKSDLYVNPKKFYEVEQHARPSTGVGLAKNGPKSEFQSYPDPNPGLTGSNPISTPNLHPIWFLLLIQILIRFLLLI